MTPVEAQKFSTAPAAGVKPRIFLGLCEIAGYYHGLQRGLAELGIPCTFAPLDEHPFKYGEGGPLPPQVEAIRAARAAIRQGGSLKPLRKLVWRTYERALMMRLFRWAVERHDVFVFGFKTTFQRSFRDLAWLRRRNKQVICIFHGSDSRPPYLDGSQLRSERQVSAERCIRWARRMHAEVRAIEDNSDVVVVNPFSAHFHQQKSVSFFALGIPYSFGPRAETPAAGGAGASVRILHSPSHPESKGTAKIREIVADLRTRGRPVEYAEIINQPNAAVQKALRECDFVVDQMYSDTPMAGFAAEAAAWGRPAVVGSYATAAFKRDIPPEFLPPTEACQPEDMAAAIENLVTNRGHRLELGRRAREFVETRWNHRATAERLLQAARGDIPETWTFSPRDLRYLHGYGMSEARVRREVRAVVEAGGARSLCLSDKPELEKLMLSFAGES